jgi:hypothetical protein
MRPTAVVFTILLAGGHEPQPWIREIRAENFPDAPAYAATPASQAIATGAVKSLRNRDEICSRDFCRHPCSPITRTETDSTGQGTCCFCACREHIFAEIVSNFASISGLMAHDSGNSASFWKKPNKSIPTFVAPALRASATHGFLGVGVPLFTAEFLLPLTITVIV